MTGLDARFLYSETPTAHMHTLKVAVIDLSGRASALTPEIFVEQMGARLDRLPALRRRIVPVPFGLGHPVWVEDPAFDLHRHVRWRVARSPGGDRELADVVAEIAATQLPRDRPLWDLTVVEGLDGGRSAFVVKLHHALADGGAAVAMLENAFVLDDDEAIVHPACPEAMPSRRDLVRSAFGTGWQRAADLPGFARRSAAGLVAARGARRDAAPTPPLPFAARRTSLNVSLEPARTYAMTSLPIGELLGVKRAAGVTLNDVFLAVCGGALRRYLARRGELPVELVAGVPVATHVEGERLSGNHVDNLMLPLGTDLSDPRARVARIHDASIAARRIRDALGTDLFEYRAGLTPPLLYPLGIRLWGRTHLADRLRPPISLVASNVRGPRSCLELEGGVVTALYSVGPILEGIGLNITAWSYVDRLYVSVLGCPRSLPDPWGLVADLTSASDELVAAYAPG